MAPDALTIKRIADTFAGEPDTTAKALAYLASRPDDVPFATWLLQRTDRSLWVLTQHYRRRGIPDPEKTAAARWATRNPSKPDRWNLARLLGGPVE